MRQYLLAMYQPVGAPPPAEDLEPIMAELRRLEGEMKAAGAWVFSAALHPTESATVVRGPGVFTDGPFVEGKEHLGGFTLCNAEDLDAALNWGSRMAAITGLPIEVRPVAWASM